MAAKLAPQAVAVSFREASAHFALADGYDISAPQAYFPGQRNATRFAEPTGARKPIMIEREAA